MGVEAAFHGAEERSFSGIPFSTMLLQLTLFCLLLPKPIYSTDEDSFVFYPHNSTEEVEAYYFEEKCPSDVLPCTCEGPPSFLVLHCDRITEESSIHRASWAVYYLRHFGKFSLTNSRILQLESNVLGLLQFEYIHMRKNTLTKIGKEFLESSRETLKRIEIVHNDIEIFPFKELAHFSKLEYINLKYNSIKSIPDEAFGKIPNDKIKVIDLSFNKINHVGSNAFKYLTRLEKLDLRYNKLTVINNMAFAGLYENPKLTLHLGNNKIMFVSEGSFQNQVFRSLNMTENSLTTLSEKAFKELLERMAKRRTGTISVGKNRFRCTCDKVEWIVRLPTLYQLPILDFECSDRDKIPLQDLTLHEMGCTSS